MEITETDKALAAALKSVSDAKGLKQEALAGMSGVSQGHISLLMNAKRAWKSTTLDALCRALEITPSEFMAVGEAERPDRVAAIIAQPACPAWARALAPRVAQLRPADQEIFRRQVESTLEMLEQVPGPTAKPKSSKAS